ncbi:hypothetical protein V6N13_048809 [Hibiscus sabdariffa]|uniref:Uncharacterized protein n=1 Tax=Hibiscus sabdariffa TaxID=183260 RepID=A0ABR2DII4_9ROSI
MSNDVNEQSVGDVVVITIQSTDVLGNSNEGNAMQNVSNKQSIMKNSAYMSSNPEKKNKASKKVASMLDFIPIVGTEVRDFEHTPLVVVGNHTVVLILEEGQSSIGATKPSATRLCRTGKGSKERVWKGLQVQC